ncbi:uncharacterized protein LOC120832506 [Gasterosteus aculeatus]
MHLCPVCAKSFPSPYKLRRHYVIHTGQKPFICTTCGKCFTQSDHLKTHLQNVHHPRLPTDCLQDAIAAHNQQANGNSPAARINIDGMCRNNVRPSTVSCSVASQPEWKRESVAPKTGNPLKKMPRVNDTTVTWSCISNVMDPMTTEQVDSASEDTSVYLGQNGCTSKVRSKSYISSPRPTKELEWSGKSGPTFSKQPHSKEHLQEKELSSSGGKMTLKHRCTICLKTFCSPSKLQRHSLIHTGQRPHSCTVCRKAFRQKVHLKSHLSSENRCSLSVAAERKKHIFFSSRQTSGLLLQPSIQQRPSGHQTPASSSVELELQCKISVNAVQDVDEAEAKSEAAVKPEQSVNDGGQCRSMFDGSDEQEQEYIPQESLKPFQCMICNSSLRLDGDLICHHKINRNEDELGTLTTAQNRSNVETPDSEAIRHSPQPDLADPLDLNVIVKPESWSVDCTDHKDSLPPDCEVIPSAQQPGKPRNDASERHKIHRCQMCLKRFPSTSKLQRHMLTHTGQRPFGCEVCGKRFRQKTHLRVHFRTHLWSRYHKQRSLYINRPPSRVGGLNRTAADVPVLEMLLHENLETHSGHDVVSLKPPTPSVGGFQRDNAKWDKLSLRVSKKSEVVRKVSTVRVERTPMAGPMPNPGNVQHKCLQCLKCFPSASKLERHEMVHTGLRPFHCVFCGKAFRQAAHLKTHQKTHCERKPSKAVNQQENIRKLKGNGQRQPRISARIPGQNIPLNRDGPLSYCDGTEGAEGSASLCTRRTLPVTKVSSPLKTNSKRKVHSCRICFRSFAFPYKLSRHLATHSGTRPYKCTLCRNTFTQLGHLKVHEQRCGQGDRVSHCIEGEVVTTNHLQDECLDDLTDCADFNADATSVGPSFADIGSTYFSEAEHTEWLAVPEGLQKEKNELEKKMRDDCGQATCSYDQDEDHYNYSFPSELSVEIDKLVQNHNRAAPLFSQYKSNAYNVKVTCPPKGIMAVSDGNKLLKDRCVTSSVENQMQPENSWCEPLNGFEYDTRSASHESEDDLEQYLTNVHRKTKESVRENRCDICFKLFVSPSKLRRHFLIHTGLRPFRCDICGKTFTQSAHVRTHQLTH